MRFAGIRSKDEMVKGDVEGLARWRAAAEMEAGGGRCIERSVKVKADVDANSLSNGLSALRCKASDDRARLRSCSAYKSRVERESFASCTLLLIGGFAGSAEGSVKAEMSGAVEEGVAACVAAKVGGPIKVCCDADDDEGPE